MRPLPNVMKRPDAGKPLCYPVFPEGSTLRESGGGEEDVLTCMRLRAGKEAAAAAELTRRRAEEILLRAEEEAEKIRREAQEAGRAEGEEAGFQTGCELGRAEGMRQGYEQGLQNGTAEAAGRFFAQLAKLDEALTELENRKESYLCRHRRDLALLAVHVAEKVVGLSLSASGRAMEKMIVSAADGMKLQEWVKVSVSDEDFAMLAREQTDIGQLLGHVSPHVRLETVEGAAQGTLIVETPDRIIDACSSVQIEQIRACFEELDDELFEAE